MKKIFLLLAAVVGLSFTSCTTEEGTVYMIQDTVESQKKASSGTSAGDVIYDNFTAEIIAWDKQNASSWQWTVTTKNGKYTDGDNEAVTKYQKYESELDAIYKKYQSQLDALQDDYFELEHIGLLKLQRIGDQKKVLAEKQFKLTYKK